MNAPGELDAAARSLIDAGRDGSEPTELNRARVRRAVELKLAAGAAVGAAVLTHSQPAFGGALKLAASLVAAGAVATGAAVVIPRLAAPTPAPPAPVAATVTPVTATAASPEPGAAPAALTSTTLPLPSASPAARAVSPPARTARSVGLAQEIDLLARANAAVNAGDGEQALRLLAEYDRARTGGHLGEERAAAGVLALCASGRVSAARAAAARFERRWPKSPLRARIAGSCAGKP